MGLQMGRQPPAVHTMRHLRVHPPTLGAVITGKVGVRRRGFRGQRVAHRPSALPQVGHVWKFHSFVDVWLARPELPKRYSGWRPGRRCRRQPPHPSAFLGLTTGFWATGGGQACGLAPHSNPPSPLFFFLGEMAAGFMQADPARW